MKSLSLYAVGLTIIVLVLLASACGAGDEGAATPSPPPRQPPHMGDHWHATFEIFICGDRQPDPPQFSAGVHTHGDGVMHIHPFGPSEEGAGARLVKFFEYGGGKLTQGEIRVPGHAKTWENGDQCDDGTEGVLQLFVDEEPMADWSGYIPQDGDEIRIVFGPTE